MINLKWSLSTQSNCLEFFSPPRIRRFLDYFWSRWSPHHPIVHKPLFDACTASTPLLCVMVIIGACLSPRKNDGNIAKIWLDSAEELVFNQPLLRGDYETSRKAADHEKEKIQCIQSAYLMCSVQNREGSGEAQTRIRLYRHAPMVAVR